MVIMHLRYPKAFSECKGGGANFQVGKARRLYRNLKTGFAYRSLLCKKLFVQLKIHHLLHCPKKMFVNGDAWGWPQDWSTGS